MRVRFLPSGREIDVPAGTHLTTAAAKAGATIVHDCDAQGVCGTCRVRIESGAGCLSPLDPRERAQLGAGAGEGWRLCCLVRVFGDVVVRVPEGFAYPPELQPDPSSASARSTSDTARMSRASPSATAE